MKKTIYSDESKILCSWLKEKRLEVPLTIRELALKLDTAHSIIGKIEIGERKIGVVEWLQYCEALNANPSDCLKRLEQSMPKKNSM